MWIPFQGPLPVERTFIQFNTRTHVSRPKNDAGCPPKSRSWVIVGVRVSPAELAKILDESPAAAVLVRCNAVEASLFEIDPGVVELTNRVGEGKKSTGNNGSTIWPDFNRWFTLTIQNMTSFNSPKYFNQIYHLTIRKHLGDLGGFHVDFLLHQRWESGIGIACLFKRTGALQWRVKRYTVCLFFKGGSTPKSVNPI